MYTMTEADFTKKYNPNNYGEDAGHVGTLSGCGSHEVSSCLCERFEPVSPLPTTSPHHSCVDA